VKVADLNGDGQGELLFLQAGGEMGPEINTRGHRNIDPENLHLYCLTAVTLEGKVLWQDGTPWGRPEEPFIHHGGTDMLLADDIDADGRMEVVVIRRGELVLLDAAGAFRRSVPMLADNYLRVYSVQLGEPGNGKQLYCKVNDKAYPPWEYGNPNMVYNSDLSVLREPFAVRGSGHNIVAMDIDGDGRDEIFNGYSLFDHDLTEIRRLDLGPEFDYVHDHADQINVCDMNGDGRSEVCYAGSEDFFVTDLLGQMLWRAHAGHSQSSVVGPWGPNHEARIIMSEKNLGLWGLDAAGTILWHRTDLNGYARGGVQWASDGERTSWALFRPQLRPITPTPYQSDPAWSRGLWPQFMDGDGTVLDVFPWDDAYAQPARLIRCTRSYDCGVSYGVLSWDMDGDGLDEVLIFDRHHVWVFHCEQ
jgi:hypothetical protein